MPVLKMSHLSTSAVTYFVRMSAVLSLVGILCSDTTPPWIRFWMNMNLSSMFFAHFDTPCLVAMDLPAELSVWMRTLMRFVFRASMMKFLMYSTSCAPVPMA